MADFNTGTLKGSIKIDFGSVLKAEKAVKSLQGEFSAYTKAASKAASSEKARVRALGQVESNLKKLNATQKNQVNATKKSNAAISKAVSATKSYQAVVEGYGASSLEAAKAQVRMKNSIEDANRSVREATNNAKAQVAAHRENVCAARDVTTATRNKAESTRTATLNTKQYEAALTRSVKAETQIRIARRNSAAETIAGEQALDKANRALKEYRNLLARSDVTVDQLAKSQGNLTRQIELARVTTTGLNQSTANARSWFRSSRAAASQFGLQLQDVAVQAQMGTNALVILGQQGSQLLGFFGAGGALAGALLAVGASVAYIASAEAETEEATKALDDALSSLRDTTDETSEGLNILGDELFKVAERSLAGAQIKLREALLDSITAINEASNLLGSSVAERVSGFRNANAALEQLTANGRSASKVFEILNNNAGSLNRFRGFSNLNTALKSAQEELGTTQEETANLIRTLNNAQTQKTEESFLELIELLFRIQTGSSNTTDEFTRLSGQLVDFSNDAIEAIQKGRDIREIMADLPSFLKRTREETESAGTSTKTAAEKADEYIASLREEYETLGMNEVQLARYRIAKLAARDSSIQNVAQLQQEAVQLIKNRQEREKLAARMESLEDNIKSIDTNYLNWVENLKNSIDPMREVEKQVEKIWKAFEEGDLGSISKDQVQEYVDSLIAGAKDVEDQWLGAGRAINEFTSKTADSLTTMRGVFNEGSKGYKALTVAVQALNAVQAVNAVLNQASGDPYTAFARMAAMAAAVASLGVSIGNISGGGSSDPTEERQAQQGTGTVLGDVDAKTESIANATDMISETNQQLVNINTGMLRALQAVQAGISGAGSLVARDFANMSFTAPGTGGGALGLRNIEEALHWVSGLRTITEPLDEITELVGMDLDPLTSGLVDMIEGAFGSIVGGDRSVKDTGVRIIGGRLQDIINNTLVDAFATIEEDGGWFGSDESWNEFFALPDDTARQFSLTFEAIADSVRTGADSLNLSSDRVRQAINNFQVEQQLISLEGLNPEERAEELEAYFGTVFDRLAGSVVPFLDEFQNSGEGLGETLARISTQARLFDEALITIGSAFDYTLDAYNRAKIADSLTELFGGIEEFANVITGFEDNFLSCLLYTSPSPRD